MRELKANSKIKEQRQKNIYILSRAIFFYNSWSIHVILHIVIYSCDPNDHQNIGQKNSYHIHSGKSGLVKLLGEFSLNRVPALFCQNMYGGGLLAFGEVPRPFDSL